VERNGCGLLASYGAPFRMGMLRLCRACKKELRTTAMKAGAVAELCWWPARKRPTFLHEDAWP
jgi:hypothetical protein